MKIDALLVLEEKFLIPLKKSVNAPITQDGMVSDVRICLIVLMERNGIFLLFLVNVLIKLIGMDLFVKKK